MTDPMSDERLAQFSIAALSPFPFDHPATQIVQNAFDELVAEAKRARGEEKRLRALVADEISVIGHSFERDSEPALYTALRDARIAAGQLQADVAAALGVTQTALSYWENGRRSPSLTDLGRWAETVGCHVAVASKRRSCGCGDDALYWRGWDDCATTAVQAMAKGRGDA